MENTDEQMHPNWRALATVHIPLKRFIKEGTNDLLRGSCISREKYMVSEIRGEEIKEFYEKLVTSEDEKQTQCVLRSNKMTFRALRTVPKTSFEVRKYFQCAMENKVDELKNINFKDQNLNVCDTYGWSALMMATCEGAYESVKYLLELGADRFIKDKSGISARDLAWTKGYMHIINLLENHRREPVVDIEENIEKRQPFYCETCKQSFSETSENHHETSTIHLFNIKSDLSPNKLQKFNISSRNKGLQLMVKQGWDKESGLGPSQSGRLYPIKTIIRKQRTGLGVEQEAARVTHFLPYDRKAVQSRSDSLKKKTRSRNDIRREAIREWKRDRRLRNALN